MPLKKGFSPEVVSGNIKELVKSGYKPKQAVAISLAKKRKFKKMSEGGMVKEEDPYEQSQKGMRPVNMDGGGLVDKEKQPPVTQSTFEQFQKGFRGENKKYKGGMMGYAEGGEVEPDLDEDPNEGSHNVGGDMGEPGLPVYSKGEDREGLSDSVMLVEAMNRHLQAQKYAANQNTHDFDPDDSVSGEKMAKGGVVQGEYADTMVGNKPELEWIDDGDAEPMDSEDKREGAGREEPMHPGRMSPGEHAVMGDPMGMGLSVEAKEAIARKRKSRRYGAYDPR